jgi:hypothetical protein
MRPNEPALAEAEAEVIRLGQEKLRSSGGGWGAGREADDQPMFGNPIPATPPGITPDGHRGADRHQGLRRMAGDQ